MKELQYKRLKDNLNLCALEIKYYILSFCEGYIRAELKIKNVSVKLSPILDIEDKLELNVSNVYHKKNNEYITYYFINKKNTDHSVGYTSKSYDDDTNIIHYHWIHICR
jgi:hypothetical protein